MKRNHRIHLLYSKLSGYGLTLNEIDTLLSCQRTLNRWATLQCNGDVERREDGTTWLSSASGAWWVPARNLESIALRRITKILSAHKGLAFYHNTDPRGCSLYIYRKRDAKGRSIESCLPSIGTAVCL